MCVRSSRFTLVTSEHQEVDDKANEKLHLDAVHGKLRKRRRGGIDVDVSDSDEDEDARGIRGKMKKPKRAPENIEELGTLCAGMMSTRCSRRFSKDSGDRGVRPGLQRQHS